MKKTLTLAALLFSLTSFGQTRVTEATQRTYAGSEPLKYTTERMKVGNTYTLYGKEVKSQMAIGNNNVFVVYKNEKIPCMAIGNNSAYQLTTQEGVIVIGDNYKNYNGYKDFDVIIDSNWWYFKTAKGKLQYQYIHGFLNGGGSFEGGSGTYRTALAERNLKLQEWVKRNIIPNINTYYGSKSLLKKYDAVNK